MSRRRRNHTTTGLLFVAACLVVASLMYLGVRTTAPGQMAAINGSATLPASAAAPETASTSSPVPIGPPPRQCRHRH